MTLSARDLMLTYGNDPVINDVSLDFDPGQITVIIGPNGSGKSTLLTTLAGQLPISAGKIELNGISISAWSKRKLARELALLPQEPQAPEGILVRQMVTYGRFSHRRAFRGLTADDKTCIDAAMKQTEITDLAEHPLNKLSGGQRQRVWIAMALAQAPRLLLLDEPTSYLDLGFQHQVLDLLRRLNRESGLGVIMVLHDINQASFYADRLIALEAGGVIADGAPAEVVSAETISRLYGLPVDIHHAKASKRPYCVVAGM